MRLAAIALLLAATPALAQASPPKRMKTPPRPPVAQEQATDGINPDVKRRQDAQQRRWDETNKRAIGGICRGC